MKRQEMESWIIMAGISLSSLKIFLSQEFSYLSAFMYFVEILVILWLTSLIEERLKMDKMAELKSLCRPFTDLGVSLVPLFPITLLFGMVTNFKKITFAYYVTCIMSASLLVSTLLFLLKNSTSNYNYIICGMSSNILGLIALCYYSAIGLMESTTISFVSSFFYFYLLRKLFSRNNKCFSLGEAIIVAQLSVSLLLVSTMTLLSILNICPSAHFNDCLLITSRTNIFLTILSISCILVFTLFALLAKKSSSYYAVLLGVLFGFSYPACFWLLQEEPISWFVNFTIATNRRTNLMLFWLFCTGLAVTVAAVYQIFQFNVTTIVRKLFHLLVIAIFLPGMTLERDLTLMATTCAFAGLLILESIRLLNIYPLGIYLHTTLQIFLDEKDLGVLILTPLYLLLGSSLPFWIIPNQSTSPHELNIAAFAGILSLGVGDTIASAAGSWSGKHKWPDTRKSVEGTMWAIFVQSAITFMILRFGNLVYIYSTYNVIHILIATSLCCLLEGFTQQVDNLILPIFLYSMLIVL